MSFAITFCYNGDPINKINKNVPSVNVLTVNGVLREESSIVDPIITVEFGNNLPTAFNYAYIPQFLRYYFITDTEAVRNGVWRIYMHCDVLKSFAEGILGSPALVKRSSSLRNKLLNDNDMSSYQNPQIITKSFPSGFNIASGKFVLTALGDKVSS